MLQRNIEIDGIDIAYREAGPADAPAVLLLHGFPSSSHMFRNLIPILAAKYRVLAPDYPGFGDSAAPGLAAFPYDFAAMAALVGRFAQAVGAKKYALYMQDYGGPVGLRLACAQPERVRGLIVQNAVANVEGWNPDIVAKFAPFWNGRTPETEAPFHGFLSADMTRWQYEHGATRADKLDPAAWTHDQARLDRPGNAALQLEMLWNYRDNVARYPEWADYLKAHRPPMLIAWGKNDPFFTPAGIEHFAGLVPDAEIRLYDAGHFALETHAEEIGAACLDFLARLPG